MMSWKVMTLAAAFALAGISTAKADIITTTAWDVSCGSAGCTSGSSLGSLTIDQNAANGFATSITYTVNLSQGGAIWIGGHQTFFADVTGSIASVALSGTNSGTWKPTDVGSGTPPNSVDGLNTNPSNIWDVWAQCSAIGTTNCGTSLTLTVTGTGLGVGFASLPKGVGTYNIYAGLDVSCASGNLTSTEACPSGSPIGQTGVVGATATPVPGPIFGGGWSGVGVMVACAGLAVFARRRRFQLA